MHYSVRFLFYVCINHHHGVSSAAGLSLSPCCKNLCIKPWLFKSVLSRHTVIGTLRIHGIIALTVVFFFFLFGFVISKATFLLSWSSGCWWRWQLQPWASRDFLSEPSQCPLGQNPPTESPSPLPGVCEGAVPQYSAPGGDWERPKGSQDRKHNLCWPAGRKVSLFQHRTLFSFIAVGTLSIVWTTVLLYLTNNCKFRRKKKKTIPQNIEPFFLISSIFFHFIDQF